MFGHDHHEENKLPEPDAHLAQDTDNGATAPPVDDNNGYLDDVSPVAATDNGTVQPTAAADDSAVAPATDDDATTAPTPATNAAEVASEAAPAAAAPAPDADKLLDIKQQALQQLTPLVGHLEQNPEEKFRTTMMMIQASDNHQLVATAYEAAQQITDEKVRAQALLDIVNEINYFTHSGNEAA
jgi:hypothetical protein